MRTWQAHTVGRLSKPTGWIGAIHPARARRALRPMDTIIGTVTPGNRAFAYIAEEGLTGSTGFAVLRPSAEEVAPFVYVVATNDEAIDRLANLADGAAYPAVRPEVVLVIAIRWSPKEVIRQFSLVTRPLIDRMSECFAEVAQLAELRDALLPRLISGKPRLPETGPSMDGTPA